MQRIRDSLYGLMMTMYGYAVGMRSLEEAIEISFGILGFVILLFFLPPYMLVKAAGYMILGVALGIGAGRIIPEWDWIGFAIISIIALILTRGH